MRQRMVEPKDMVFSAIALASLIAAFPPHAARGWRPTVAHQIAPSPGVEMSQTIVVGSQRLHACTLAVAGYCGHLTVPLNWLDRPDGTIPIRFQWVPAFSPHSKTTIVAEEGGPGYATTGTGSYYHALFRPIMRDHNLLMMDQRGTGGSAAIFCKDLQPWGSYQGPVPFFKAAAECGYQLDHTYRDSHGAFVHASDLFGTSQSVRDLAAILAALDQGPVDFYGDSYGSFFGQVFASRYPGAVRSLVLDSTYPTIHQDPFDTAGQDEIRFGFDAVCRRSHACHAVAPGHSTDRIHALALALDEHPLVTDAMTPLGKSVRVRIAGPDIETLLAIAGDDLGPYRDLDASARAYLERGDGAPLARLFVWSVVGGPAFLSYDYREFSEGMYIADVCTVYRNPFRMDMPVPERHVEYAENIADLPRDFGYPVGNTDVFNSPTEGYDSCITWPAPVHRDPIITQKPPIVPATLPVLIISGDLDETTSPGDARQAAAALGPSVQFASLPNQIHVPALGDPFNCASAIVLDFVRHPGPVDTSCGAALPEVRTVGVFPLTSAEQPPAVALPGNTADAAELRLAALALQSVGDAIQGARYAYNGFFPNCGNGYCGPGLRGGRFSAGGNLRAVTLEDYAFADDAAVSGSVGISGALLPEYPGFVRAHVSARDNAGATRVRIDIEYDERARAALAEISGVASDGRKIIAVYPAP